MEPKILYEESNVRKNGDRNRVIKATGGRLEFPILINRLDGPFELLTERLREEFFDGDVIFLAEDDSEARINVVLMGMISW